MLKLILVLKYVTFLQEVSGLEPALNSEDKTVRQFLDVKT